MFFVPWMFKMLSMQYQPNCLGSKCTCIANDDDDDLCYVDCELGAKNMLRSFPPWPPLKGGPIEEFERVDFFRRYLYNDVTRLPYNSTVVNIKAINLEQSVVKGVHYRLLLIKKEFQLNNCKVTNEQKKSTITYWFKAPTLESKWYFGQSSSPLHQPDQPFLQRSMQLKLTEKQRP